MKKDIKDFASNWTLAGKILYITEGVAKNGNAYLTFHVVLYVDNGTEQLETVQKITFFQPTQR